MIPACLCSIARKSELRPSASRAAKSAPASRRSRATSVRPCSAARCSAVSLASFSRWTLAPAPKSSRTIVSCPALAAYIKAVHPASSGESTTTGSLSDSSFRIASACPDAAQSRRYWLGSWTAVAAETDDTKRRLARLVSIGPPQAGPERVTHKRLHPSPLSVLGLGVVGAYPAWPRCPSSRLCTTGWGLPGNVCLDFRWVRLADCALHATTLSPFLADSF